MKIPSPVRTSVRQSSQGFRSPQVRADPRAFGVGIGQSVQELGGAIAVRQEQADREAEADRLKAQRFEASRLLATEGLHAQRDLLQRQQEAPLGAPDFTKGLMTDYEARHEEVLAGLRERGFDEDVLREAELNFLSMRENLQGRGLTFQQKSYQTKLLADVDAMGMDLSQLAAMNPSELEGALELLDDTIDEMPGIDAIAKEEMKAAQRDIVVQAAGFGLAQSNPGLVVDLLTDGTGGGDYYSNIRSAESSGNANAKNPNSSASGLYQFTDSTWAGLIERYPNAGLTIDGRFDPAQQEVAIRLFTEENAAGLDRLGIAPTNGNLYAAHFLGLGDAGAVLRAPDGASIAPLVGSEVMAANPFLQGMTVADFKAWAGKKGNGGKTSAKFVDGKTGNPVLDSMDAQMRRQVLAAAQTELSRQRTDFRGGFEQRVENAVAAFATTGGYAGQMPSREEFFRAYDPGEAQQKWTAFEGAKEVGGFVHSMNTMTAAEIQSTLESFRPTNTASPTYAREVATFDNAQKAAANVLEQRSADPAGYVMRNYPGTQEVWKQAASGQVPMQQAYTAMSAAYDELEIPMSQRKPWTEAMAAAQVEHFNTSTFEQKMDFLTGLRTNAGDMYPAALEQLSTEGMETEAYLSGLMSQSPVHRATTANVLRGMEIIANDPSRKPIPSRVEMEYRSNLGEAQQFLNPKVSGAMLAAATALYVQKGGGPEVDDTDLFAEALREVSGGLPGNENTGLVQMNWSGPPTILPPTVAEEEFTTFIEGLSPQVLTEYSVDGSPPMFTSGDVATPDDIIDEGTFIKVGPSQYIVRMASDGQPLVNAQGQRYVMRLTPDTVRSTLLTSIAVEPTAPVVESEPYLPFGAGAPELWPTE